MERVNTNNGNVNEASSENATESSDPIALEAQREEHYRMQLAKEHKKPKQHSKFQIITMVAVWSMIIFMLLGVLLPPTVQIIQQYF